MCYSTITFYCGCARKIRMDCRSPRFGCFSSLANMTGAKTDCERHRSASASSTTCGRAACEEVYPDAPRRSRDRRHHNSAPVTSVSVHTAERIAPRHYIIPGPISAAAGQVHEGSKEERRRRRAERREKEEEDRQREARREARDTTGSEGHRAERVRRDNERRDKGYRDKEYRDEEQRARRHNCEVRYRSTENGVKDQHRSGGERGSRGHKKPEPRPPRWNSYSKPPTTDATCAKFQKHNQKPAEKLQATSYMSSVPSSPAYVADLRLAKTWRDGEETLGKANDTSGFTNDLRHFDSAQAFSNYQNLDNLKHNFVDDRAAIFTDYESEKLDLDAELRAAEAQLQALLLDGQSQNDPAVMSGANYMLDSAAHDKSATRRKSAVPRPLQTLPPRTSLSSSRQYKHKKSSSTSSSTRTYIPERSSSKRHSALSSLSSSASSSRDKKHHDSRNSKERADKPTLQRLRHVLGAAAGGRRASTGSDVSFGCVDSNRIIAGAEPRRGVYSGGDKHQEPLYVNGTNHVSHESEYGNGQSVGNWI
ncbi:hypothetical protein Cpir12675_002059 [Ceratocystis pirilliformis]|uniref:Uncharacterized protein n=1 Tax=Ceratocystis pirilliformis TaxID=259994 RepID=A0ABR3ZDI4_9PEZI